MILAEVAQSGSYASSASGYVITILLTIVTLGGGFMGRSLVQSVKELTTQLSLTNDKVNALRTDVAVILDRQKKQTTDPNKEN